jgi:uncharacterized OsmC-like protein
VEDEIVVGYRREGDGRHVVSLDAPSLQDIRIDHTGISREERAGTATRLLCASALYCFASTLGSALEARGAEIRGLTGRAIAQKGRDDYCRTRVSRIRLEIDVDLDEADLPILEKCRAIMARGCLVTYSLMEGIEVEHVIRRAGEA